MNSSIDKIDIRRLDGSLLLVFRELLRLSSVTKTAESLNLSQSTISHALGRLRDLFGDPLFLRKHYGLQPTQRALELGPQIEQIIDLSAQALGIGKTFEPAYTERTFRASIPEFVLSATGSRLANDLEESAPHAHYWVEHSPQELAFEGVRTGYLDGAVGRFDGVTPDDIVVETLYVDSYCVVARKQHPKLRRGLSEQTYHALRHAFADSTSELTPQDRGEERSHLRGGTVPRWLSSLLIVAQSDSVATCPRRLAESQAQLLGLDLFQPPFHITPIQIELAQKRDLSDLGSKWFIERLKRAIG